MPAVKPLPLLSTVQLGAILQSARKGLGLTQAGLAERLSLSQSRVSHLEQNPGDLSVDQLLNACAALGLELTIGIRGDSDTAAPSADGGW